MQFKAVAILCVLLSAQVFAVRDISGGASRSLKQQVTTFSIGSGTSSSEGGSGFASVDGTISVSGPGSFSLNAQATALSFTSVEEEFVIETAAAIVEVENGGDAIAIAEVNATAYSMAVAETVASSMVVITSTIRDSNACASAMADANATAEAFAKILVNVLAEASDNISFADASLAISAILGATASSFASAQSMACGSGVFNATTFIEVLSTATARPFIEVVAMALALVAPGATVSEIDVVLDAGVLEVSTVDGRTASEVFGESNAASSGTAGASTTPLP